jgi:hypothetical protein
MRIEKELQPHATSMTKEGLVPESSYYFLNYVDEDMLIPTLEPVVFVGKNFEAGDQNTVYFQDMSSYNRGIRYQSPDRDDSAAFYAGSEDELGHVFAFEHALDELLRCDLRRKRIGR